MSTNHTRLMRLITLCATFCLMLGCTCEDQDDQRVAEWQAQINEGYKLSTTGDTLVVEPFDRSNDNVSNLEYLVSKDALRFLKTEIYTDSITGVGVVDTTNLQIVDEILTQLHIGTRLAVFKNKLADLSGISTADTMNVENIIEVIKNTTRFDRTSVFDEEAKLHIYLFDRSSFFKTANAIAFESGDHKFIFGNARLFRSSMLFVHELGHVLGLNHSKESYGQCFNIMHESSIGCAKFLHPRQSLAASTGVLIGSVTDTTIVFPTGNTECTCLTSRIYNSELDIYLNARDQGIEDEPLIGNLEGLEEAYNAIVLDSSRTLDAQFIDNFNAEADYFLSDPGQKAYYVQESAKAQKVLQINNLLRLMSATVEKLNPSAGTDFLERIMVDGEPYDTLMYYFNSTANEHDPSAFYRSVVDPVQQLIQLQEDKDSLESLNRSLLAILNENILINKKCYDEYLSSTETENFVNQIRRLTEECRPTNN